MSAFSSDVLRSSSFLLCFDCHLRLRSLFLNTELHNCYFSTLASSSKTWNALHIAQFCWLKHFPSPSVKSVYLQLKPVEKISCHYIFGTTLIFPLSSFFLRSYNNSYSYSVFHFCLYSKSLYQEEENWRMP